MGNKDVLEVKNFIGFYILAAIAVLLLIALPLAFVKKQVMITDVSKKYNNAKIKYADLHKEYTELLIESEKLSDHSRIEGIARDKFAMEYPEVGKVFFITSKKKTGSRKGVIEERSTLIDILKKSFWPEDVEE